MGLGLHDSFGNAARSCTLAGVATAATCASATSPKDAGTDVHTAPAA
jgi:hypothetical protein